MPVPTRLLNDGWWLSEHPTLAVDRARIDLTLVSSRGCLVEQQANATASGRYGASGSDASGIPRTLDGSFSFQDRSTAPLRQERLLTHRILIVDDDLHIREVIRIALKKAGMTVFEARDGKEALTRFAADRPDLIILDIGMPEFDGLDVCREIRKSSDVPILFLSARDDEIDRVLGLEIGGDDYVTKPFSPRELIARVNVILRRIASRPLDGKAPSAALSQGKLSIDPEQHIAEFAGTPLRLTAIEFGILRAFLTRPTLVFSRDQIMSTAYQLNIQVSDRTIDSHIRNIRAKLSAANCDNVIETIHGVGFKLGRCEPLA
jgi:two-component system, OmpR family, response regulator